MQPLMLSDCSFVRLEAPGPRQTHGNSSGVQWGAAGSRLRANIDLKTRVNQADLLGNTAPAFVTGGEAPLGWDRGGW